VPVVVMGEVEGWAETETKEMVVVIASHPKFCHVHVPVAVGAELSPSAVAATVAVQVHSG